MDKKITFSFGENWFDFVSNIKDENIYIAKKDMIEWLGEDYIKGKTIIDIGCGSGLSSLAFFLLGAKKIISFDYDINSVNATKALWHKNGEPENWSIFKGSILELKELKELKDYKFDLVYSWGVLHHTGDMWKAIENAKSLVKKNGKFWISIYAKGPNYLKHLKLKQKYNGHNKFGKYLMIYKVVLRLMAIRFLRFKNPFGWNEKRQRGMYVYHDIIDWLGGLPYEVASEEEIISNFQNSNFFLEKINVKQEGGCSIFLFLNKHND